MDTFSYKGYKATQVAPVMRQLQAQFGDGYAQTMQDGLNAYLRRWSVTWTNIYQNTAASVGAPSLLDLDNFFKAHVGVKFLWLQPPPFDAEGAKIFCCEDQSFQASYDDGLLIQAQAVFRQYPV
jgi:phage-related protein